MPPDCPATRHPPAASPPQAARAALAKGQRLIGAGQLEAAEVLLRQAVELAPGWAAPRLDLGVALHRLGRIEAAVEAYQGALARDPRDALAWNSLGAARLRLGEAEAAGAALAEALRLNPAFPEALSNLGRVLRAQGLMAEACRSFTRALQLRPGFAPARWNRATTRLLAGDLPGGWEDFEARWELPEVGPPQPFPRPAWAGESLAGRTLLLHPEQGLGDTLHFARYAPLLAREHGAARVVLGVQPELRRVLAGLDGVAGGEVALVARGETLPDFDCHLPLMAAPLLRRESLASIPGEAPYIVPDPALAAAWRARLGGIGPSVGPSVGLVWAGNPKHSNDANRSLPLARLAPLLAVPGARFFALQLGARRAELQGVPGITDLADHLTDFAETAGALAALDLLVTVDTSPGHLAGALGRPTWMLLPTDPDWRWLLGRVDSPWYPSMRLFRQHRAGDWTLPVEEAAAALRRLVAGRGRPG